MKLSTGKRINASVTTAGGSATQRIGRLIGEEVRAGENIHVPANEVPPGGCLAPLRHRGDSMPAQDIAHGLVGHLIPQVGQCSYNPVIAPAGVLASQANHQILDLGTGARPAGRARCLEPSNFSATSWRYQARMVSGLARRATCSSPLRPKRLPISARVARSPSESRQPGCRRAFQMRFSAARYSFCSRSSWLTNPVTRPKAARMWLCSSSTSIIEDRDLSAHLNILTIRGSETCWEPSPVRYPQSAAHTVAAVV